MPEGPHSGKIIKIFTFSIRKANYNTFRINWMPEGPDNVKNNQNLYFSNSKDKLQTDSVGLKVNG